MDIQHRSVVLLVKDLAAARRFYEEVMGLKVSMDLGVNIEFAPGTFALWQWDYAKKVIFQPPYADRQARHNYHTEVYFETAQLEEAAQRLNAAGVTWIHQPVEMPWAQRSMRFYDPEGNIVEVGEPMDAAVLRLLAEGLTPEEVARRTSMPLEFIQHIAAA